MLIKKAQPYLLVTGLCILYAALFAHPVWAATPPPVTVHVVAAGDTLYAIAQRYGVTLQTLMNYNALTTSYLLPGRRIAIPPAGIHVPPTRAMTHIVQAEETLTAIADRYGASVELLMALNDLVDEGSSPGQTLFVPAIFAPGPPTLLHVVVRGESLAMIGERYGVAPQLLQKANAGATQPLREGQRLAIPVARPAAEPARTHRAQRIEFAPGTVGAVVLGMTQRSQADRFVVRVQARQTMYVSMFTYDQFSYLRVLDPNGQAVRSGETLTQRWDGLLDTPGDYTIEVITTSADEEYFSLSVMVL